MAAEQSAAMRLQLRRDAERERLVAMLAALTEPLPEPVPPSRLRRLLAVVPGRSQEAA